MSLGDQYQREIPARIVNRPRPQLPDRMLRMEEFMHYIDDLACWKADKAEAILDGVCEVKRA